VVEIAPTAHLPLTARSELFFKLAKLQSYPKLLAMSRVSVINIEETIGKTVGNRRPPIDPLKAADGIQDFINGYFKAAGHRLSPRGVFRFNSHAEADLWMRNSMRPKKD
jgi:hypothetical protein